MEISATAFPSYSPVQDNSLQQSVAAGQRQAARPRDEAAALRQEAANQREQLDPRQEAAREAREARKAATTEPVRPSGFEFDYKDSTRIMKVNDSKGFLIYQVPSKGQLALLEASESAPSKVETTA